VALLHEQAHLPPARSQRTDTQPGGGSQPRPQLLGVGIDTDVEEDVDLPRPARRARPGARCQCLDPHRGRRTAQRGRDLEDAEVDVGPDDEGQEAQVVQVGAAEAAEIGVLPDALLDACAAVAQLGSLVSGQRPAELDEDVLRAPCVPRVG
jgi:hypothetical protein